MFEQTLLRMPSATSSPVPSPLSSTRRFATLLHDGRVCERKFPECRVRNVEYVRIVLRTVYSTIRTGETRELLDGERRILAPTFCLLADRPKWSFRPSKIFALMIAPTRKGLLLFYGATVLSVDTSDIQQKRAAGCFEKTLLLPVCRLCFAF